MPEPSDVYTDQFQVNIGPFGCSLNFSVSPPTPPAPGALSQAERVATVRMSLEHIKAMTFIMHRQVLQYESQAHVSVQLPTAILTGMQVRQEDWQAFWQV